MWKDAKYLLAFSMPLSALLGLFMGSYWTYLGIGFAFGIMPLVDYIVTPSTNNVEDVEEKGRIKQLFFDILLYLNLPLLYYIVFVYFSLMPSYSNMELSGATLSTGIMLGAVGINVAHELGHRHSAFEQTLAKLLLIPSLYMHFSIEHNNGHHKNVATDLDAASARKNEPIYTFWFRAILGEYLSAWQIESKRLHKKEISFWSLQNEMIQVHLIQTLYLIGVGYFWGATSMIAAVIASFIGILLLESANYIEHYGLRRKKLPNGHYEPVLPCHSWSSNHELGRIALYELTRHSDHHYKSTRKYQILKHYDESPQLPYGYPSCILISLIPPLWFGIMNKKLAAFQS
jgi:alkane 1-monooxygenase